MNKISIYLKTDDYLAEWINHTFGNPVQLIHGSPEMRVLNELVSKRPKFNVYDIPKEESNVTIPIPYFKGKNPETYNYLYKSGRKALEESFRTLFIKNLMEEVGALENHNVKISTLIYAYMEKHGIDEKHWDTVSQIYYRTRKKYFQKCDIKIR